MAATSFEGQIADAALAAFEANKASIVAAITNAEGGLQGFINAELGTIQVSNVYENILLQGLKPFIISTLVGIETANPGTVIYAWADVKLKAFAASLGG